MESTNDLYKISSAAIDSAAPDLRDLSDVLWKNPELAFNEFKAHDQITDVLEKYGFNVERKYKLDTAFRAEYGHEGHVVAVLCEYDALPQIGHACGHNLIAEVGVAVAIGVKAAMETGSIKNGKVLQRPGTYLLGTDNLISLFFEKNIFCKGAKTSKKFEIFSSFSGGYKALQITQKLTCTRHVDLLQAKLCIKCKL